MKLHHVSLKRERKSCKIPRVIMSELYFSLIWLGVNGAFPHHLHISCHQTALFKTKLTIYAEVSLLDAKHVFPCFHGMLHVFLFLSRSRPTLSIYTIYVWYSDILYSQARPSPHDVVRSQLRFQLILPRQGRETGLSTENGNLDAKKTLFVVISRLSALSSSRY